MRKETWETMRYFAPVLMVGIVGVAASITFWYLTISTENRAFVQEFVGRANNQAATLQSGIEKSWDKLYALRSFFDSSDHAVTRGEFENFSKSLMADSSAILNITWLPRVKREERVRHEQAGVRDGIPDYHIRTAGPDGTLPVAPESDEYFPKFYSTEARDSPVYGLDLNDGGPRQRTLDRSRDGDVLTTSPPLMLYIGEGDRRGFWAGLPVYARGLPHETVEDRRRNFLGLIQCVFQIRVMIDRIFVGVKAPVRMYVFPPNATLDDLPIYFTSRFGGEPIAPMSQAALAAGLQRSFVLNFGDIPWKLVVAPEQAGLLTGGHGGSSIVLIGGLLLSGALTSLIWAMRRSARKLKVANDTSEEQNLRFDAALNNMAQGLLMFSRAGKLTISNRRSAELFGVPWRRWEIVTAGTTVPQLMELVHNAIKVTDKSRTQITAELRRILERGSTGKITFERTDGRTFSATCAPMTDGGFVVTFEDITERRRTEDQIAHMAHYDALTDLPNRILFYKKIEELFGRSPPSGAFAVLSLDLDHFKNVNDTLGHLVGDKLLQAVAGRLRGCVRDTDVVARLGGDEFAIVQASFHQLVDAASLATRLMEAVSAPYQIDDHDVVVGTSVGIAIAPGDGATPNQLMTNADLALYRCKTDGGNTHRFFEPNMDARRQERLALELDLRKALANGEFTLDYQPIVNLKAGKVVACEALIRWHHLSRGWVSPLDFIPIAEDIGLIGPIGEWILNQACTDATEWPHEFAVAVNVSPGQFKTADLVRVVKGALDTSHLPASRLELEITELGLMQDPGGALVLLHQLKNLGVRIAMDDFGSGYSSLGYLRSFPFNKIKIDRSFIRDLAKNDDSLAILRAVVGLGHGLGIVTTADGVETEHQLAVLRSEGCTEAQGHLLGLPKSPAEVKELLNSLDSQAKAIAVKAIA